MYIEKKMGLDKFMLPCVNKKLFGYDCPGCGTQRAFLLLLKGDFEAAFHMYPAIYPLLITLLFVGSTFFINYKYEFIIKISLIVITGLTMIVSYAIKMNFL